MSNQKSNITMEATINQRVEVSEDRCTGAKAIIEEAARRAAEEDDLDATKAAIRTALEPLETCRPRGAGVRVEVQFDYERTREEERQDAFYAKTPYKTADGYLEALAGRFEATGRIPRIGEKIIFANDLDYVTDVWHDLDEDTPDRYLIFIGSGDEPIEDEPIEEASSSKGRRIPQRVQTMRGEEDTIFVVENMRGDLETLHAIAQSVWKTLEDADELRDWECVSLMDYMVGELGHQRDQVDSIVRGYYGREDV